MNTSWFIRGGRIIDPAARRDETADLYIREGQVAEAPSRPPDGVPVIDAGGLIVAPGFIDLHVHFREPGNKQAETIESGLRAAARGGFSRVVLMPNTRPPVDSAERVSWVLQQAKHPGVHLMTASALTQGRDGRTLADLAGASAAGAVAFTDDGTTVGEELVLRQAMQAAVRLAKPILDHAEDRSLSGNGVMHDGPASRALGLPGIPTSSETVAVERDIRLCRETGCRLHIQHVSAAPTVDMIRSGREEGLPVSGEVTPHHLAFTDEDVDGTNPDFKMNPPVRGRDDRASLIAAVADGTLQAFATDHAPHTGDAKRRGFLHAPFGVIGLETAVGITYSTLVKPGLLSVQDWIHRWTHGPAAVLGLSAPGLSIGAPADVVVLDLNSEWTVRSDQFLSRSRNCPFEGHRLVGRAVRTFCGGGLVWNEGGGAGPR